jgi:hypothetical protein
MFKKFSGDRRYIIIITALFLLVLPLGYWRMVPHVCGNFHDDGIYVITAKALAQGQGYRLIYLPHSPLQTKYPILYPALLAVIWKLWPAFPDNLLLMKWFSLLCGAATISLSYLYFLRFGYFSRAIAASSALVCATSPIFLYFSTQTLSEIPYALLVIVALWSFETQLERPHSKGSRQFLLGVLLALPFLCRSIGVTLVVATLLVQYYQGRPLRWMTFGITLVMLPWFIWMAIGLGTWNRDPLTGYYTDYLGWWLTTGGTLVFQTIWHNFLNILISSAVVTGEGIIEVLYSMNEWVRVSIFLFLGSLPLISFMSKLSTWRLLPFYLGSYLLLVLVWPWHPFRFLVPILPFLLAYFFQGISTSLDRWASIKKYLLPLGLGLLLVAHFALLWQHGQQTKEFCYPFVMGQKNPAHWSSYKDMFRWLKSHSQPEDVIASMEDPMIFLYTGRRAIRPFKITPGLLGYGDNPQSYGSAEDLIRTLKAYKVRYLAAVPIFAFDQDRINTLLAEVQIQYPDSLKPVYVGKDKRFVIFELPRND